MAVTPVTSRVRVYNNPVRPAPNPLEQVSSTAAAGAGGDRGRQAAEMGYETMRPVTNAQGEVTGRIVNTKA